MIPYVTGAVKESPRNAIMYFSDDGEVMAVRVGDYKFNLAVQRATRMMQWAEPLVKLRLPLIYNLRRDPFERADFNSNTYFDWMVDHVPQLYLMQATVAAEIDNFVKFPPRSWRLSGRMRRTTWRSRRAPPGRLWLPRRGCREASLWRAPRPRLLTAGRPICEVHNWLGKGGSSSA
jgi:C-terminal region of aryl-sulfatase